MLLPRYQYYVIEVSQYCISVVVRYDISTTDLCRLACYLTDFCSFSLYRFAQIRTSNDSIDFCWVVVVVDRNRSSLNVISFIKNNLLVHASLRYRFVYLSSVSFCVKLVLLCNWCWRKRYENCRLRGRTENSMLWLVI